MSNNKTDDRVGPSRDVERALRAFYGGKVCVVTGAVESGVDWHHLNEKRADSRFSNFIPLDGGLNSRIGRFNSTGCRSRDLTLDLEAPSLLLRQNALLREGNYAAGYGVAILGAHIARQTVEDGEWEMRFLAYALHHARVMDRLDLSTDLLRTFVDRSPTAPAAGRAAVLLEMGAFFQDYDDQHTFRQFAFCAQRLLSSVEEATDLRILRWRLDWKIAASFAASNPKEAVRLMTRMNEMDVWHPAQIEQNTALVWSARVHLAARDPSAAKYDLRQLFRNGIHAEDLGLAKIRMSAWTLFDALVTLAQLARDRDEVEARLREALKQMYDHRIVPTGLTGVPETLSRLTATVRITHPVKVRKRDESFALFRSEALRAAKLVAREHGVW